MTKTLTEQWKDGELLAGLYYFRKNDGLIYIEFHDDYRGFCTPEEYIKEVLAPVPSYEEWQAELDSNDELLNVQKRLEKKLAIATKALELYSKDDYISDSGGRSVMSYPHIARKALKEMEGVK